MKPIIIIPTYNEVLNIEKLIKEIHSNLENQEFSILIVDDNSTDGTKELINNLKNYYQNLFVLNRPEKMGLASAYIDGIVYSINEGFNTFIEFDADFSHNPKYLPYMLNLLKDNDVVIGSRNIKDGGVKNWPFIRKLISKGGSLYARTILNCPIKDLTGGFNGWTIDAINKINLKSIISNGYAFQIEMKYKAYKNNCKIKEFPIIFEDRKHGKSKMSKSIFIEAMKNVIKIKLSN